MMIPEIFKISLKSISFYRKQVFYQFLIIVLLCAVITGSLMTGRSVRTSLKKISSERLGNTGVVISTGLRYFEPGLVGKFSDETGMPATGLLEIRGSSQGLISQESENNTSIYAVSDDFFGFHGSDSLNIGNGEVIVNRKLAANLGISEGDDVILKFRSISDIPADAPFSPSENETTSAVFRVGKIIDSENLGNFSLSISQITPSNIFMNLSDLENITNSKLSINRLIVDQRSSGDDIRLTELLKRVLVLSDAGLELRESIATGEQEIIADRIFIEQPLISHIQQSLPKASPVITYLANTIESESGVNPYSFVAAMPGSIYAEIPGDKGIFINEWLAEDLKAGAGDSLKLTWYSPDSLNHLVEKSGHFIVEKVVERNGIWADSMLMPEFPGIAGSESCSDWDAGVPVRTNLIRPKDEDYWDDYKGTPKAFISYETGKEIWGSNYGPATAIRFSSGVSSEEIVNTLSGNIDPSVLGFTVTDLRGESMRAAEESVDFGMLFISLGFFLIVAAFVLLSFAVSYYFDLKKTEINTLFSIGFRNKAIRKMLLFETTIIAVAAVITGGFAGYLVNMALTEALNSVWTGAVQTNTLVSSFDFKSVASGMGITLEMTLIFIYFKSRSYFRQLSVKGSKHYSPPSSARNLLLLIVAAALFVVTLLMSLFMEEQSIALSFVAGTILLVVMILSWRHFYLAGKSGSSGLSRIYYSFYPSNAVTPILFIAAGIFAVFITAVNRKNFDTESSERSSGTGGYYLWMESSLPIIDDLKTIRGKANLGIDDEIFSGISFIQMKRTPGNDASCLNLNHITAPPLLGVDPSEFISDGAFSFAKSIRKDKSADVWRLLDEPAGRHTFYGIADQTVLDWGLKIGVGDTLILRAENGQPLYIIIAAGLQSSVFQGYVLVSNKNFIKYYPSVSGHSVFLADGQIANDTLITGTLNDRLSGYGISIEKSSDRLAEFYQITNTYLSVFGVFGGLGMITGIAGLGFVLLRNYTRRRREFALMLATGFTFKKIRKMMLSEQILILSAGVISGILPAIVATLPSIRGSHELPWLYLSVIIALIFLTGLLAVLVSTRSIRQDSLIQVLRKE